MKIKLYFLFIVLFLFSQQIPVHANLAEESIFWYNSEEDPSAGSSPDNNLTHKSKKSKNTDDTSYTSRFIKMEFVKAFDDIRVLGIAHLEFAYDGEGDKNLVEVSGEQYLVQQIAFSLTRDTGKTLLFINALGNSFNDRVPKSLPLIKIHYPKSHDDISISSFSTEEKMTKIYIDSIRTKTFTYNGTGDSLLTVFSFKADNAKFYTKNLTYNKRSVITSADIELLKVNVAGDMYFDIEGSSNVILSGKSDTFHIDSKEKDKNASVHMDAEDFEVKECNVNIFNQTTVKIQVSDKLKGYAFDSSAIYYDGNPIVRVRTSDHAVVKKIGY